jgi:hypothetical protein
MRSLNSRYGEVYFPKELDRLGTEVLYLNGREIARTHPSWEKTGTPRTYSPIGG